MSDLPVPVETYREMMRDCFSDIRNPRGTRQRRSVRKRRGARDAAILALAYTCGATVSELLDVKKDDCDLGGSGFFGHGASITLPEREPRSETLPLSSSTRQILRLWLSYQGFARYLFHPISKNGVVYESQLTQKGLHGIIKGRYEEIQEEAPAPEPPNAQRLRRSFKTLLKRKGVKDAIIRDLMGLRSRRTTKRDDETADQKMEEALNMVAQVASPPGQVPSLKGE